MNENIKVEHIIYELSEVDKVMGEIYMIKNIETNIVYIGQTRSHRKNKGKYRPFGSYGRFKDHISEAINNTKKNQCTYLNNAIRKYGRDKFDWKLLETCKVSELNDREQIYIKKFNSLFPNGYNLTKGGKSMACDNNVNNDSNMNEPKKRGRGFGFKHTEETINRMKARLTDKKLLETKKNIMGNTMTAFYDKKKIDFLSKYKLDNDIKKYIKPICKKDSDEIHNYVIKIDGHKLGFSRDNITLEEKYNSLLNLLTTVKEKQDKK